MSSMEESLAAQGRQLVKNVGAAADRGQGIGFERTRRITGYLVGTLDRFNNAKRAEERDRVKHGMGGQDGK